VGRALPAKWQVAAAAVAAFLLYTVWAAVADWAGWRGGPESPKTVVATVSDLEERFFTILRELAAGDVRKRDEAEKLSQEYITARADPTRDPKKGSVAAPASADARVWKRFDAMMGDPAALNVVIVDYLARNASTLPTESVAQGIRRILARTKTQSVSARRMAEIADEIERALARLPNATKDAERQRALDYIHDRLKAFYAARSGVVRDTLTGARSPELTAIGAMPFESGARVFVKSLGEVDEGTLIIGLHQLRLDWRVRLEGPPWKAPLFPERPREPLSKVIAETEEKRKESELRHRKWDLQAAIAVLFRDCQERYRERYLGFMQELFGQYVAIGQVIESVPVREYYPAFLLADGATANERLQGSLAILFRAKFTRATQTKLKAMSAMLIGKECPAEALDYPGPKGETWPRFSTLGVVPKDVSALPVDRLPFEAARALDLALQHCEPRSRAIYAGHIIDFVRRAMQVKPRRRTAAAEDGTTMAQLQSAERPEITAGLKRALLLPAITETMAGAAEAAAERLFQEQCPVSPYPSQLEAYRAIEAGAAKLAAKEAAERAARK
jgi:hypothetical protein